MDREERDDGQALDLRFSSGQPSRKRNRYGQEEDNSEQANRRGASAGLLKTIPREHSSRARLCKGQNNPRATRCEQEREDDGVHRAAEHIAGYR